MASSNFRLPGEGDVFYPLSGKGAGEDWDKEFVLLHRSPGSGGGEYSLHSYSMSAQQLHADGTFNPDGKEIHFSMSEIETVEVLRTMQKVFVKMEG